MMNSKLKILFFCFLVLNIISCSKEDQIQNFEQNYIKQFFESESFKKTNFAEILGTNEITFAKTTVRFILNENKINVPVVYSSIYTGNRLIGALEGVKFSKSLNSNNFNIMLRNFSKFEILSNSGLIILNDLTESVDYLYLKVKNSEIISAKPVSERIIESKLLETRTFGEDGEYKNYHPMDSNKDGNVSFSECYAYANASCQQDPVCYARCYGAGDAWGWVQTGLPLCQAAIAAACVYTSTKH